MPLFGNPFFPLEKVSNRLKKDSLMIDEAEDMLSSPLRAKKRSPTRKASPLKSPEIASGKPKKISPNRSGLPDDDPLAAAGGRPKKISPNRPPGTQEDEQQQQQQQPQPPSPPDQPAAKMQKRQ